MYKMLLQNTELYISDCNTPHSSAETKRKKQNFQKIILKQLILYYV